MAPNFAALKEQAPGVKLVTPESPDFEDLQSCYVKRPAKPSAVARPKTAEDVQALIKYCVANNVDFVIRGGGHDCGGRTLVNGALSIDVREINSVKISADKKTATIGGGILFRDLTKALGEEGLVTPVGTIASVGYVGWASLGGYGPFSTIFGLGVDQIVAAKLVNGKGELIEANDELLKGVRGGGGIFGAIVEVTIKTYPLKELLVSTIIYESSDLKKAFTTYAENFEKLHNGEGLPKALQIQPFGIEFPGVGKVLAVIATWADDDHEEGKRWADKIAGLAPSIVNMGKATSVAAFCEENEKLVVYGSYGRTHTMSFKKFSPALAEVLAKYTEKLPGGAIALSLHMLRAPAASEDSVFGQRLEHQMLELVSTTPEPALEQAGEDWALAMKKDLRAQDADNILETSYVSIIDNDEADYSKIYGKHYDTLLALKKKYDPDNVFKHAIPQIIK